MIGIEQEHSLRFEVKIGHCVQGHVVPSHTTGPHALCSCGWELWSRNGRAEVYALHALHQDFERQKQQEQREHVGSLEAAKHAMQLNVLGDAATCSYCGWFFASTSIASIMNAFTAHQQEIRDAIQ